MIIFSLSLLLFIMWIVMADILPHLKHKEKHNPLIVALMFLYGAIFITIDIIYNFTIGTVVFLQWPTWKNKTLSERLRRILVDSNELGWRWKLAYWICRKLISPWDYNHCRIGLG